MTVESLALDLSLWPQIVEAVQSRLSGAAAEQLLAKIAVIPVRPSRALYSLGAYVSRGGRPTAIRLQFSQHPDSLKETLLHEVAHACDHLCHQGGRRYRRAHGPLWRLWAEALGIEAKVRGDDARLAELRERRLKVVAVCQRCGVELRRLRRLNRKGRYLHTNCGGRLRLI